VSACRRWAAGFTLPFLLVYLNQVRGLELGIAALAVSTVAVAGLAGNPLGGWLADRGGPRDAVAAGLVVAAAGAFAVAGAREPWQAFAGTAVVGLGAAMVWPAQDALLAAVVRPEQRSSAFAVQHALLNLGFGLGGLAAAVLVRASSPGTFEWSTFWTGSRPWPSCRSCWPYRPGGGLPRAMWPLASSGWCLATAPSGASGP
jgi:MFS family permease